jgi:hypothetical protein
MPRAAPKFALLNDGSFKPFRMAVSRTKESCQTSPTTIVEFNRYPNKFMCSISHRKTQTSVKVPRTAKSAVGTWFADENAGKFRTLGQLQ